MNVLSKISSAGPRRRLPRGSHGIDINFCRDPGCSLSMVQPDPFDSRGRKPPEVKQNTPRGKVVGSGAEKTFVCGACGQSSVLKNNRAIVQEYRRLRARYVKHAPMDSCKSQGCEKEHKSLAKYPGLNRKSGKTAKGVQRWKCKACLRSFSLGSRIR